MRISEQVDLTKLDEMMARCLSHDDGSLSPSSSLLSDLAQRIIHWAALLQRDVGIPVFALGRILSERVLDQATSEIRIAVPHVEASATLIALRWSAEAASALLNRPDEATLLDQVARCQQTRERLERFSPPGENSISFLRAADKLDIPWSRIVGNTYAYGHGARASWLYSSLTEQTPALGVSIARNKLQTAKVLRRAGLPTPDHQSVTSPDMAAQIAAKFGYPVVVKPIDQDGGRGVSANLHDESAVRTAFDEAKRYSNNILVEKHVAGRTHRLTVFQGQLVNAVVRTPGGVVGDGMHTVQDLLDRLNADPRRGRHKRSELMIIDMDDEALSCLSEIGMTPLTVPAKEQFVALRRRANSRAGGTFASVMDQVHPDNKHLAERAAEALRLDLAGVDLLIPDISVSWLMSGATINEVNAAPGLNQRYTDVIFRVLSARVKDNGRIPLILILEEGASGDLASHIQVRLEASGLQVGRGSRKGIWLGSIRIAAEGTTFFAASQAVLSSREVEAAVLVATPAEILEDGLPFDRCDLIVLAGSAPDTPANFEQWHAACTAVLPHTRGSIIISADNPECLSILPTLDRSRVTLVSGQVDNAAIQAHLRDGGQAAWPEVDGCCGAIKPNLAVGTRVSALPSLGRHPEDQSAAKRNLIAATVDVALGLQGEFQR
ncbi:acetate--CoA ligase family protein [Microvirga pakistanensis]|uniref:acetate--CoA ligase family protein n=1 Tax=Microvirga pakistanensis TaxID=1682650 RepID=UPI0010696D6E|nr:acetate--CoA ligase family protein [Microvirga pakistanensis]